MKLVVNIVARGRPDYLVRALTIMLPNVSNPETKIFCSLDADDLPNITSVHNNFGTHSNVHISVKPREDATSAKYNRALELEPDLICNLSDYTAIVTPGFDNILIEKAKCFPDGIGVVVNPMRNASFSDIYCMTRPMYRKLGWY